MTTGRINQVTFLETTRAKHRRALQPTHATGPKESTLGTPDPPPKGGDRRRRRLFFLDLCQSKPAPSTVEWGTVNEVRLAPGSRGYGCRGPRGHHYFCGSLVSILLLDPGSHESASAKAICCALGGAGNCLRRSLSETVSMVQAVIGWAATPPPEGGGGKHNPRSCVWGYSL